MSTFRHRPALAAGGILVAAAALLAALHAGGLAEGVLSLDDRELIGFPAMRQGLGPALRTFLTPGALVDFLPLRDLTYWWDVHVGTPILTGRSGLEAALGNAVALRLQNLAWLLAAAFAIARLLRNEGIGARLSAAAAAAWLVHPVHAETFLWSSARKDAAATALALWAFALWSAARTRAAGTGAHALSLLTKPSAILLPPALLARDGVRRVRPPLAIFVASAIALIWALIQWRIYSGPNDIRFDYAIPYRVQASLAAWGRELVSLVAPRFAYLDVDQQAPWVDAHRAFIPVGAVSLALLALAALRRKSPLVWGFWATYLPYSGWLFAQRQFYSVRYFELPAAFLFVAGASVAHRRWGGRKFATGIAVAAALAIAGSAFERAHWRDGIAVFEKGLAVRPDDASLNFLALSEILNRPRSRWTEREDSLYAEILPRLERACPPDTTREMRNGDLCRRYWNLRRKRATDEAQKIGFGRAYLRSFREVAPGWAARFELAGAADLRIADAVTDPELAARLRESGPDLATPEERAKLAYRLCLLGDEDGAKALAGEWAKFLGVDGATYGEIGREYASRAGSRGTERVERCRRTFVPVN